MGEEHAVGILTLVCAATGGEISSGAIYHSNDLKRARKARLHLRCRFCGKSHLFGFADARLGPIRRETPRSDRTARKRAQRAIPRRPDR
jgi:hypothetical protein